MACPLENVIDVKSDLVLVRLEILRLMVLRGSCLPEVAVIVFHTPELLLSIAVQQNPLEMPRA